jgi:hypothetical protein
MKTYKPPTKSALLRIALASLLGVATLPGASAQTPSTDPSIRFETGLRAGFDAFSKDMDRAIKELKQDLSSTEELNLSDYTVINNELDQKVDEALKFYSAEIKDILVDPVLIKITRDLYKTANSSQMKVKAQQDMLADLSYEDLIDRMKVLNKRKYKLDIEMYQRFEVPLYFVEESPAEPKTYYLFRQKSSGIKDRSQMSSQNRSKITKAVVKDVTDFILKKKCHTRACFVKLADDYKNILKFLAKVTSKVVSITLPTGKVEKLYANDGHQFEETMIALDFEKSRDLYNKKKLKKLSYEVDSNSTQKERE